jgi:hypothetical protein
VGIEYGDDIYFAADVVSVNCDECDFTMLNAFVGKRF